MSPERPVSKEVAWVGLSTLGRMGAGTESGRHSQVAMRTVLPENMELHDGRFLIREVLGRGGEGVVYEALDRVRGEAVALKLLHLDEATWVPQLKREFRFLRNLIHPRLVHLHELFVGESSAFFTMALVRGKTFLEAARDRALLRQMLGQIAEALEFLHQSGRVHRDIKPSNILVRDEREIVLVDFGVALDLSSKAEDHTGLIGTLRYLAPEISSGAPASPKSDAYSLGVLLFEALTGRLPFRENWESAHADAPLASSFDSSVPADLDALAARLLRRAPSERASISEVLEALADPQQSPFSAVRPVRRGQLFAGRERELARLHTAREQMLAGREPLVALVAGRSGFGKSAFLEEFFRDDPGLVLSGVCSEDELVPHKAFDGVIDGLARFLMQHAEEKVFEFIRPEEATFLVPLFPELREVKTLDQLVPGGSSLYSLQSLRKEAYRALGRVCSRIGETLPLSIVIDDLQWGDIDSARLLLEAFAGEARARCLLVLAYRSEERERSPCLNWLLSPSNGLTVQLRSLELKLGPLDERTAERVLESRLGDAQLTPAAKSALLRDSEGTPLLLTELGSFAAEMNDESIPAGFTLKSVVEARKAKLSEKSRRAFSLLATARSIDTQILAGLVDLPVDRVVVELESARLASSREGGRKLVVLHDKIRESELELSHDQQKTLHGLLADALRRQGGEPAQIARHYMESGQLERASSWAERAAILASRSFALTAAVDLFRLALAGEPSGSERAESLEEALAFALADAGYGAEAAPRFVRLAEKAEHDQALFLRIRAAAQWLSSGSIKEGWNEIAKVQADTGLAFPKTPRAALLQAAKSRASIWLKQRRNVVGKAPTDAELQRLEACRAGWSLSYVSTTHGAANSARYLDLALSTNNREHLGLAYGMEALFRATSGTPEAEVVAAFKKKAFEFLREESGSYHRAFLDYVDGQGNYLLGHFAASLRSYELSEPALMQSCRDVAWELSSSRIFWGSALILLGRHRELDRRLVGWLSDAQERGDLYAETALLLHRARRLSTSEGDYPEAVALVQDAVSRWHSPYVGVHSSLAAFTKANIYLAASQPEEALSSLTALSKGMARSMIKRVQVVRTTSAQIEGFARLALAHRRTGFERKRELARVRKLSEALVAENSPQSLAYAAHLAAVVSYMTAPSEANLRGLESARNLYLEREMALFAAALSAQIGRIRGGKQGEAELRAAHQAFLEADSNTIHGGQNSYSPNFLD